MRDATNNSNKTITKACEKSGWKNIKHYT